VKLRIIAGVIGGLVALIIGINGGTFLETSASGVFTGFLVGVVFGQITKNEEK
jgi:hypothetical protein